MQRRPSTPRASAGETRERAVCGRAQPRQGHPGRPDARRPLPPLQLPPSEEILAIFARAFPTTRLSPTLYSAVPLEPVRCVIRIIAVGLCQAVQRAC